MVIVREFKNQTGSALLQTMIVVAMLSVLAGTAAQMSDLSSKDTRKQINNTNFEALGQYVATLGADNILCTTSMRPVNPTTGLLTFKMPATVPILAGAENHNVNFQLPLLAPGVPAGTWFPQALAANNRISKFGNVEVTGLVLEQPRYTECLATQTAAQCQAAYTADSFREFQGSLILFGRGPNVGDPAYRKTIARLKMRIESTTGDMKSCFTTVTDEEYCKRLGGTYDDTPEIDVMDPTAVVPMCDFRPRDLAACSGAGRFISDISSSGVPQCGQIAPCGLDANGEQEYAVGITSTSLRCKAYPRRVITATPTPVAGCAAQSGAMCDYPALAAASPPYSGSCNAGFTGSCTGTCDPTGTWVGLANTCAAPPPPPPVGPANIILTARAHCVGVVWDDYPNTTTGTLNVPTDGTVLSNTGSGGCSIDPSAPSTGLGSFECEGFVTYNGITMPFDFDNGGGGGGPFGTVNVGGASFSVTAAPGGGGGSYGVVCRITVN